MEKDNTDRRVWIRGNSDNPGGVIRALEKRGGINKNHLVGNGCKTIYLIGPNSVIESYGMWSDTTQLLMAWGTEIQPEPKEQPKPQFKPFDRVVVRDDDEDEWTADYFSYIRTDEYPYVCVGEAWKYCLPYNEQTAKLIGTTDEYNED